MNVSTPCVKICVIDQVTGFCIGCAEKPDLIDPTTVAVGDVNGDGTLDIITGSGPGDGSEIKLFDGTKLGHHDGHSPNQAWLTGAAPGASAPSAAAASPSPSGPPGPRAGGGRCSGRARRTSSGQCSGRRQRAQTC